MLTLPIISISNISWKVCWVPNVLLPLELNLKYQLIGMEKDTKSKYQEGTRKLFK